MTHPELREPDVLSGPGARREAAKACEANGRERAFLISSATVARETPLASDIEEVLGDIHAGTHTGIGQHAPHENVKAASQAARDADADVLISLGGGSVIDAAKFVQRALSDEWANPAPHHIAVPTTLSGSEFTLLAGWTTEGSDGQPVKTGMSDPRIVPDVALLDPEACTYTPRWLWAATGVRAVDHACEGITSQQASELSDQRCVRALELFAEHLATSVHDDEDLDAHEGCLEAGREASAGINYAASGAGLSHKLGKALGSTWDVPHGVTSAITLPAVMAFEAERQPERTRMIAEALGAETAEDGVRDLIEAVGVERPKLEELGVKPTDVPWIVEYAIGRRDSKIEQIVLDLL